MDVQRLSRLNGLPPICNSQLDPRVQEAAARVLGFPTGVRGLVRSSGAAEQVRRALGKR